MLLNSSLSRGILLIWALSLWAECITCGSSFLSPTQKPQSRGDRKLARVGRRAEQEPPFLLEDKVKVSAPFQLSVSLTEAEYKQYGPVLQKVLLGVLDDVPFLE